jgi:cobalt/nickel transport system permease protein
VTEPAKQGVHGHEHRHDGEIHRHPHHHEGERDHRHTHPLSFERFSYICSPVHELDPRAKIVAAFIVIFAVVLAPAPRAAEFIVLTALLLAVALLANLPLLPLLARSALVLPVAGGIALFAPLSILGMPGVDTIADAYREGWPLAWRIVSKAWLSALTILLVSATTSPPQLFAGLRRLGMPMIFITMLTFLSRYASVLGDQLSSMRKAVASRGFSTKGWRLIRLYGNLAGNLFIRAYERGERVHAAMLSRGYDGTLPYGGQMRVGAGDALAVVTALLIAGAVVLY